MELAKRCASYGLEQEILNVQNGMEQIESGVRNSLQQNSISNNSELLETDKMKGGFDKQISDLKAVCEELFKI